MYVPQENGAHQTVLAATIMRASGLSLSAPVIRLQQPCTRRQQQLEVSAVVKSRAATVRLMVRILEGMHINKFTVAPINSIPTPRT